MPDRLPPVAPLLDAELGISLPDALAAHKVSLPQEQLDLLCSSFVAAVAPVSHSSLARLRRELRRIGASAASILPPGAARAARRGSLHHGASVVIVVETKMSVISHACVRTLLHQPSFGFLLANGTAGGILLAWSPPLTGVVVHVGDFNFLLSPTDSSSPINSGPSMSAFRAFVDEFGLFDVPPNNVWFSWSNNRNPPILRRLDRIFLSPELFSAFPSSSLILGLMHLSDHVSMLLSLLRGRAGTRHVRFRFELWWLRDDSFVATVPNWCAHTVNGRWAAFRLSRKLHSIRREVLTWKRIFWSNKFSEVTVWDEEILSLQASDNISVDQSSRLLCLQCLAQEWWIRESVHCADVFVFCDEFASNSLFLKEFNRATCVLVPKRPNLTDVAHSRPISILGTPYKIIAKLLSLRLAPVMPSIINPFQVAFIMGRRLQDAVVLANEVVHSLYCLRLPSFILKLDISKAFDSAAGLPMDCLGLQITSSPPASSFWNGIEQKLTDHLHCWQGKQLSLSGRITLAKHCLASVPLHALAVFRPPVAVLSRFDKLIHKFIWNGDRPSDRLAHWDVVAFARLLGGAGVTNLSRACESSLCSWW
ncbi:Transposon TX1 uncharacterized protein [Nymphaea thermarum]|nr:Transposon TX1 uncharacterized protein [Nymphaea thermarum]